MNQVFLSAELTERKALRYTLTGVPIIECKIHYQGLVEEAKTPRKLDFTVSAIALGEVAERLEAEMIGTQLNIQGFLAMSSPRSTKLLVHITEYE